MKRRYGTVLWVKVRPQIPLSVHWVSTTGTRLCVVRVISATPLSHALVLDSESLCWFVASYGEYFVENLLLMCRGSSKRAVSCFTRRGKEGRTWYSYLGRANETRVSGKYGVFGGFGGPKEGIKHIQGTVHYLVCCESLWHVDRLLETSVVWRFFSFFFLSLGSIDRVHFRVSVLLIFSRGYLSCYRFWCCHLDVYLGKEIKCGRRTTTTHRTGLISWSIRFAPRASMAGFFVHRYAESGQSHVVMLNVVVLVSTYLLAGGKQARRLKLFVANEVLYDEDQYHQTVFFHFMNVSLSWHVVATQFWRTNPLPFDSGNWR